VRARISRLAQRLPVSVLAVIIITSAAHAVWAVDLNRQLNFRIGPQRLATALIEYSHQAHVQIIIGPEVGERRTAGILGVHAIGDALATLLAGSPLGYRVINDTSITVASAAALQLQSAKAAPPSAATTPANRGAATTTTPSRALLTTIPAENDKTTLDEFIVTGTHIAGVPPVGSAVAVYSRDDIAQSGAATLDQFARSMPDNVASVDAISNPSSNIRFSPSSSSNGNNSFEGASFNLHGLGPTATLTLLNGQRLAPGGLDGSFTDISQIPVSAVDRIEVLPDGASAIYGSDAVGGVVNLITRKDFDGAESSLRYGASTEGGADEVTASQLVGHSWSTGNVLLDYEFDDQNGLSASQRAYIPDLGGPVSLIPQNRRNSLYVSGSQELDAKTTIFGDVLYSERDFSAANTFSSPPSSFSQTTFASGTARQLSVTASLDHDLFADWHAQITGNYSRNQQTSDMTTNVIQGSSPMSTASVETSTPSLVDVDAIAQGSLLTLPGGPLRAALGVSYRREQYEFTDLVTTLDQTASTGEPTSKRQVFSVYGEFVAPVVLDPDAVPGFRRIDISLAGRFDYYSDFNSTLNPKLGVSWEVVPGLSLKGTFGTSFQAPLLSQLHAPLYIETELLPNIASATGSTDTLIIQGGNLDLHPETSKSYTGGFDLKPPAVTGFSLSMNFFYVDFTNKISTPPTSSGGIYSLNDPALMQYLSKGPLAPGTIQSYFNNPAFSGDLARLGPSAVQVIFDDQLTNLASTIESGIDLTTQYALTLGPGRLSLSLNVERLMEDNNRAVAGGAEISLLNAFAEPPKWKGRAAAVWTQGPVTASASVDYVNAYRNSLYTAEPPVDSWTTADLYLGYRTGDAVPSLLRQLTVALSITNVADVRPPRIQIPASFLLPGESVIPFDPVNASPVGREISLMLEKGW
jgi:outer membrane receptor protein involved in Fe transport